MKKILLLPVLLLGLLFSACSSDETVMVGSIYGIVTDFNTGEPVRNASVMLSPSNRTTVTGNDGHYEFVELDPGQYKIQVSASGYVTDSRQVTVTADNRVSGDLSLRRSETSTAIRLSNTHLNFGSSYNELVLDIMNIGNGGSVTWNVTGIDVPWLSVAPSQGEIDMGKSASIKVFVNRKNIKKEETTFFTINAAGGSSSVKVTVLPEETDKPNPDDPDNPNPEDPDKPNPNPTPEPDPDPTPDPDPDPTPEPDPEPTPEDYSSADIIMNSSSVEAKIISCRRYGSTVEFYYTIENMNLDYAEEFRILTPFNNMSGTKTTVFYDNLGNEYENIEMTFRGKGMDSKHSYSVYGVFPMGIPCKCSVILKNVDPQATKMNFVLAFYNYMGTEFNEDIKFKNVPIY